jgi:outer membrane protein
MRKNGSVKVPVKSRMRNKVAQPLIMKMAMLLLLGGSLSSAEELELLSTEKKTVQEQKKAAIDAGARKLRYEWLAPLNLSLSISEGQTAFGGEKSTTKRAAASISQDFFRSGGIYYAIRYADAKQGFDTVGWETENATFAQQIVTSVLTLRRSEYELRQSKARLDNYDIEIFLKQQEYEAGNIDITLLNNAIMDKNAELKNYLSIKYSITETSLELAKLSDIDPEKVILPEFELVDKETYLEHSYNRVGAQRQSLLSETEYKVTRASYLPALSLEASAGYLDYVSETPGADYDGDFYTIGAALSMPLQYNSIATLEESRANVLRRRGELLDSRREEGYAFEQALSRIEIYREYIDVTAQNLSLYKELIDVTQKGVEAGYYTGYDLQTLKNSRIIDESTIKINEINIQIELAKLHYSMQTREHEHD